MRKELPDMTRNAAFIISLILFAISSISPADAWQVDGLSWEPGASGGNKQGSFLTRSDPAAITNRLTSCSRVEPGKCVEFGFNANGGGYLWSARARGFKDLPDGFEFGTPGYGRGMLGAIRDQMHRNAYNPEPAGRTDYLGVPVKVETEAGAVTVPQYELPLFSDGEGGKAPKPRFKFTATQSEFDYSAITRDVSAMFDLPAIVHSEYYAYARKPDAIGQFTKGNTTENDAEPNAPILDVSKRIADISPDKKIDARPADTDLSMLVYTVQGIRPPAQFSYLHYRRNGAWVSHNLNSEDRPLICNAQTQPVQTYHYVSGQTVSPASGGECILDRAFVVLSDNADPEKGTGMALFVPPDDPLNAKQINVVDGKSQKTIGREDRRIASTMVIGKLARNRKDASRSFRFVAARNFLSGMLSPVSAAKFYGPTAIEILTGKSYTLFGTPEQIFDAISGKSPKARSEVNIIPAAAPAQPGDGYDIFVIAGHSNAINSGFGPANDEAATAANQARVFQLGRFGADNLKIIPAGITLQHWNQRPDRKDKSGGAKGFALPFAYRYAETLKPGRNVLLIPVAKGSTSITDWDNVADNFAQSCTVAKGCTTKTDSTVLYDDMVRRIRAALDMNPKNRLVAVLLAQGEPDILAMRNPRHPSRLANIPPGTYEQQFPEVFKEKLESIRSGLRKTFGDQGCFAFLTGEPVKNWVPPGPNGPKAKQAIVDEISAAAKDDPCKTSAVVDSSGLPSGSEVGDTSPRGGVHFSAKGQLGMGERYLQALEKLRSEK
jgi:Carbohydrate esterase, sialic acid-specific acetylesterase